MSLRVWDWISNVAVMVGLVLLVAGVYAGLGLAAALTMAGVLLVILGVVVALTAHAQQERSRYDS